MTTISDSLVNTVCSFFKCSSTDHLNFDVINVERQRNDYDCGVFSIAFAAELSFGGDPANCTWNPLIMRSHLLQALERKDLKPFLKLGRRAIRLGRRLYKTRQIVIYCTCHMPNDPQKGMVQCCSCLKWYHIDSCIKDEGQDMRHKWACDECSLFIESFK